MDSQIIVKTPESKRKANDKWDKEHMTTLGCKIKRKEAEQFKAYAVKQNKTANTLLKEYVIKCISEDTQPKEGE